MLSDSDLRVIVLARSDPGVFNIRYDNMIAMAGMARELLRYREAAKHQSSVTTGRLLRAVDDAAHGLEPNDVHSLLTEALAYRMAAQ